MINRDQWEGHLGKGTASTEAASWDTGAVPRKKWDLIRGVGADSGRFRKHGVCF